MCEIEGFREIIGIISLAKELHSIGRFDIVENKFSNTLDYDSWFEDMQGVITSIFSDFCSNYDDCNEVETMIFTDDVISKYYCLAWEYGLRNKVSHKENPFVLEAAKEVGRRLNFCCALDWEMSSCTMLKETARQSKLIVYMGLCECDCHSNLAYGLVKLYKWFSDKVAEHGGDAT